MAKDDYFDGFLVPSVSTSDQSWKIVSPRALAMTSIAFNVGLA